MAYVNAPTRLVIQRISLLNRNDLYMNRHPFSCHNTIKYTNHENFHLHFNNKVLSVLTILPWKTNSTSVHQVETENYQFMNKHTKENLRHCRTDYGKSLNTLSPIKRNTRNSVEHIKTHMQLTKRTI